MIHTGHDPKTVRPRGEADSNISTVKNLKAEDLQVTISSRNLAAPLPRRVKSAYPPANTGCLVEDPTDANVVWYPSVKGTTAYLVKVDKDADTVTAFELGSSISYVPTKIIWDNDGVMWIGCSTQSTLLKMKYENKSYAIDQAITASSATRYMVWDSFRQRIYYAAVTARYIYYYEVHTGMTGVIDLGAGIALNYLAVSSMSGNVWATDTADNLHHYAVASATLTTTALGVDAHGLAVGTVSALGTEAAYVLSDAALLVVDEDAFAITTYTITGTPMAVDVGIDASGAPLIWYLQNDEHMRMFDVLTGDEHNWPTGNDVTYQNDAIMLDSVARINVLAEGTDAAGASVGYIYELGFRDTVWSDEFANVTATIYNREKTKDTSIAITFTAGPVPPVSPMTGTLIMGHKAGKLQRVAMQETTRTGTAPGNYVLRLSTTTGTSTGDYRTVYETTSLTPDSTRNYEITNTRIWTDAQWSGTFNLYYSLAFDAGGVDTDFIVKLRLIYECSKSG